MPIVKDFRTEFGTTMAETESDLGRYMVARRYLEDLQGRVGLWLVMGRLKPVLKTWIA